jgi:hypothetical protein
VDGEPAEILPADHAFRAIDLTAVEKGEHTVVFEYAPLSFRLGAWISLGCLRFPPALRQLIFTRFPHSRLGSEEMVRGPDGKWRYFKSLRVEMYGRLRDWLAEVLPGVQIYLCMESPRVWREVFGYAPEGEELASLLDGRLFPARP